MPLASFDDFCECVCELAATSAPRVVAQGDGIRSVAMHLRGVAITAIEMPSGGGTQVFLTAEFDTPGEDHEETAAAWLALLDANSVLPDVDSPRLSRNPLTGDITMLWPCALPDMSALDAYRRASHMADVVQHWQRHRVIHPELLTPGRGGTAPAPFYSAHSVQRSGPSASKLPASFYREPARKGWLRWAVQY